VQYDVQHINVNAMQHAVEILVSNYERTGMITRLIAVTLLLVAAGMTSACDATAEPPSPTDTSGRGNAGKFPDMSSYSPASPDDYAQQLDNPGRPEKRTEYFFRTPDGVRCLFGQPPGAACYGNNLPGIPAAICDSTQEVFRQNSIGTSRGVQQSPLSGPTCSVSASLDKVLPPFHTLTVYGVTCGVDDKGTTACKDPQGRGFVLSPSWSGWLPKV
jgi:hypothetical protein